MLCTLLRTLFSNTNSSAELAFLWSVGLMITLWLFLKHHISTHNEGKDFLATCKFSKGLGACWGGGAYLGHAFER